MKKNQNIEELFQQTFENFEGDVSPDIWANVQSQISSGAGSGSASSASGSSSAGGIGLGKLVAGIAVVGAVSFGSYYFINQDTKAEQLTQEKVEEVLDEMVEEQITPEDVSTMSVESLEVVDADDVIMEPEDFAAEQNEDAVVNENNNKPFHHNMNKPNNAVPLAQKDPADNKTNENQNTQPTPKEIKKVPNLGAEKDVLEVVTTENKILADRIEGSDPQRVKFGTENPAVAYKWTFENGDVLTDATPEVEFTESGDHEVVLEWTNELGQVQTVKRTITVRAKASIVVPNVITPNGDTRNDKMVIKMVNIESIEGRIIDPRTGQTVAQWTDLEYQWDGRDMNGNLVNPGGYLYMITAIPTNGADPIIEKDVIQVMK